MALEVAPLGIKVTLVEPGAFRTDFLSEHSIRTSQPGIVDYASTAGASVTRLTGMSGQQIGDPVRGAAAIIDAVSAAEPPLHLVLGSDALKRTQDVHARFADELKRWAPVSLGTDFG